MLKNRKKQIRPNIFLMICSIVVCLTGCGKTQESAVLLPEELLTSEQANYKTVQVQIGDYEKETVGKGSIMYLLRRNLYWENSKAFFAECHVKVGQEVKKGDILMSFDLEENRLALETLRIQLLRTKENFEKANTEKYIELSDAKVKLQDLKDFERKIAEINIEKMQAAYEQFLYESDREIRRVEEQIAELKAEMEENTLAAPFDGVIQDIVSLHEGDQVSEGTWLVRMYSTDHLVVKADSFAGNLRYNMDVIVEARRGENCDTYAGKVIIAPHILPSLASQDWTLIELEEDVTKEQLKGTITFKSITESIHGILQVESQAIHREDGEDFVYVLEGDMVQKRFVKKTLDRADKVWILDGLYEDQTLIVD